MRVLFVNARKDALLNQGGDTVQFFKTKAALECLDVTVEVRGVDELDDLPPCDVAHVFNLQMPESAWFVFQALQKKGLPIVFSPIYWELYDLWFEAAVKERKTWQSLARLLGKERVRRIYVAWQRRKAPATPQWQIRHRLLQQACRVLPNSLSEAVLLEKEFALKDDFHQKVDLIPNGIDPTLYQALPAPNQSFLEKFGLRDFVLEVGMIYPAKNQLGLIEALYDLPVPLVFVGQVLAAMTDYAEACKRRAAERGNVIFIDRLPYEDLPGIYALAAVHALPSWRETPGLVSLEAAAAGCRIVSTSIGSARDYFGDLAWYCDPNDVRSIRLATEAALQAPPSQDLRQRVLSQYTWQRTAEATRDAYCKVLST